MAGGVVPDNIQYLRAEVSDQLLRQDRPDPLHEAAGQVPFDTLARRWRDGFQDLRFELEAMLLVPDPPSSCGQPLPGAYRGQRTKNRYQLPLSPHLHTEHGESALLVEEGDPLHETGDLF
jgi:hypothetical protein